MSRRARPLRVATGTLVGPALAVVAVGLGLAGCGSGAGAARPDPKPLKLSVVPYRPSPPQLPAGHPVGAIYVLDLTNIGHVRPSKLIFASDAILLHLRWSSWGGATASAQGTAQVRDCHPDCATGPIVYYPGRVELSGLKSCDHARFYVDSSVVAETRSGPWHLASFLRNPCAPPVP